MPRASSNSASLRCSLAGMTEPVGLCGVFTNTARVEASTAASTPSAVCANPYCGRSSYSRTCMPQARASTGNAG